MSSSLPHLPSLSAPDPAPQDLSALIRPQIPLAPYTSFRVGGLAEWYCEPATVAELEWSAQWSQANGIPSTILGAGSNLLISDAGVPGLTVNTRKLRGIQFPEKGQIWAAAGEPLAKLARIAARQGWSGLEWGIGIPGTVGGAVVMNAGAHQQAMADCLVSVTVLTSTGSVLTLEPPDLSWGYRHSILQQRDWIVTGAHLQLVPDQDPVVVKAQTDRNWQQRHQTQPYHLPSCGSVFRNPQPLAAGWLIEQSGLKGYQIGGAQVAHRHANFILNRHQASATDIHTLIRFIQETIRDQWSLVLQPEVKVIGKFEGSLLYSKS
jgi:UDP-N-acetylmuramate dehydrogenase